MTNGQTAAALLGPFWRDNAPRYELGANLVQSATPGEPLFVSGVVRDVDGRPVAGANVDVWHASPVGLYENQDPEQAEMNLRGLFTTDAEGRYHFRSVRPAGYPVPTDGPCGDLLRAQLRHPYRPAHIHFMITKPGFKTLITQIFSDDAEHLETDVTFSVIRVDRRPLRAARRRPGPGARRGGAVLHPRLRLRDGAGRDAHPRPPDRLIQT